MGSPINAHVVSDPECAGTGYHDVFYPRAFKGSAVIVFIYGVQEGGWV